MIYAAIFTFLALLGFDLPRLLRERNGREIMVYSILCCITLFYMVQFALGCSVWSPMKELSEIFKKLGLNYAIWQGHG